MYRIYGTSKPHFLNDFSDEDKQQFWKQLKASASKDVIERTLETMRTAKVEKDLWKAGGDYLPLSRWQALGFDVDKIRDKCTDKKEHPILGMTYRVCLEGAWQAVEDSHERQKVYGCSDGGSEPPPKKQRTAKEEAADAKVRAKEAARAQQAKAKAKAAAAKMQEREKAKAKAAAIKNKLADERAKAKEAAKAKAQAIKLKVAADKQGAKEKAIAKARRDKLLARAGVVNLQLMQIDGSKLPKFAQDAVQSSKDQLAAILANPCIGQGEADAILASAKANANIAKQLIATIAKAAK
jgi:hypothetical protein